MILKIAKGNDKSPQNIFIRQSLSSALPFYKNRTRLLPSLRVIVSHDTTRLQSSESTEGRSGAELTCRSAVTFKGQGRVHGPGHGEPMGQPKSPHGTPAPGVRRSLDLHAQGGLRDPGHADPGAGVPDHLPQPGASARAESQGRGPGRGSGSSSAPLLEDDVTRPCVRFFFKF